ncbi:MAG: alpha-ribazole phosphatase family protein [Cellvibrionaceae bacterium]|nr:alpha-ribazole phosphatase family protein [Cellvibrionaceae bacterium]
MITTIDILRHGECIDGRCYRGWHDVALSDKGWQQMHSSLQQLTPAWDRIISSPLIRCADFAQAMAEQRQLPLEIEPDLRELHFGQWEGCSIDSVWSQQQAAVERWFADPVASPPPGGEGADELAARVVRALMRYVKACAGEHLLLVVHGGVVRALLAHCLDIPLLAINRIDVPYGCISRIGVFTDDQGCYFRLLAHNMCQPGAESEII